MYHRHYDPDDPIEEVNSDDEVIDFHIGPVNSDDNDPIEDSSDEEAHPPPRQTVRTRAKQSAVAVPQLDDDEDEDAWLIAAANAYDEDEELLVPDQQAPPSPQQPGEKPRSNFDYIDYEDDHNNAMVNVTTGDYKNDELFTHNFSRPWDQVPGMSEFVSAVHVDDAMEGAVQDIVISFKDRSDPPRATDRTDLLENSDKIAWVVGYITGYYIVKRRAHLEEIGESRNTYYKVRVTTKAYFVKPDDLNGGKDLWQVFDNERVINRFDPRGVPWGLTTPEQAYKMAAGACRRAISDTATSQSGFRYHKMHSVRISIYETWGAVAGGSVDSDMEDEDEKMQDPEDNPRQPANPYKRIHPDEQSIREKLPDEDIGLERKLKNGLLKRIATAKATVCPLCEHGCFFQAIKLSLIYKYRPDSYMGKVKNKGRPGPIKTQLEKLVTDLNVTLPEIVIPEGFPEDVPLDEKMLTKFAEVNPWMFLHVWIQADGDDLPIQLYYRSPPYEDAMPIHLLFVGPPKGKNLGHYHCITKINALFYHTKRCNNTTKYYCPWCSMYYVSKPCTEHKQIDAVKTHYCRKCMHFFNSAEELAYHDDKCLIQDHNLRPIKIPMEKKKVEFDLKHYNRTYKLPIMFVADFESTLVHVDPHDPKYHKPGTKIWKERQHVPTSFGIKMVPRQDILDYEASLPEGERFPEDLDDYYICSGANPDDVMDQFCSILLNWSERVHRYYEVRSHHKRDLDPLEDSMYQGEDHCYMCRREFALLPGQPKHPDIDYFTSKYLGAACTDCYLNRKPDKHFIPLFFHNAKGYDLHYILKAISNRCYGCDINGIPMNGEKLMSMTISKEVTETDPFTGEDVKVKPMCDIRILDSLLFVLMGLGPITDILKAKHPDDLERSFAVTYRTFRKPKYQSAAQQRISKFAGSVRFGYTNEQIEAALQKNLYPYLWFDDPMKMAQPIAALDELVQNNRYEFFTDTVTEKFKKEFEPKKAKYFEIREKFRDEIEIVLDWVNVYLTNDVCNLADVMVNFCETIYETHHVWPAYYYGGPSTSWDAFLLKLTREHPEWCPEVISKDMNMLCFFKKCIRGGTSSIMKRLSIAYNKFMRHFDPKSPKKRKYIIYFDANNLYGWGMKQKLPYGNFRWLDPASLEMLNADLSKEHIKEWIHALDADERGAFVECTLRVPERLHDKFNWYPPAPERNKVKKEDISPFIEEMNRVAGGTVNTTVPMLMQTLADKEHYYVHTKCLELYLDLGLELVEIFNAVYFKHAKFMEAYIDMNTELRVRGKSTFEKNNYKLMNNSIYGKTFEDPGKRANLVFVNGVREYYQIVSKTGFNGAVFQHDEVMIAKMLHESITYDKPLYLGAAITEYAKYLMFDFYYNVLHKFYDPSKVTLLFTDTDSLMLEIETEDIFEDIKKINDQFDCPIDVSSFDKAVVEQYKIKTDGNGVIGRFKSETGSDIIYRFAGLRSKMYAFETYKNYINEDKTDADKAYKKAKGVPKASLSTLTMNAYLDCLFGTHDEEVIEAIAENKIPLHPDQPDLLRQQVEVKGIRSFSHDLYSYKSIKYGLSCNDSKRFIQWDNINTLAYGHKDIPRIKAEQLAEYPPPVDQPKRKRRKVDAAAAAN